MKRIAFCLSVSGMLAVSSTSFALPNPIREYSKPAIIKPHPIREYKLPVNIATHKN